MTELTIYIAENCWSCQEAIRLADDIAPLFPSVTITLLDLKKNPAPETVFAVPTYILNGKVAYLGNPTREQLIQKLTPHQESLSSKESPIKSTNS